MFDIFVVGFKGEKIQTILKAAAVDIESYWPGLFAKALEGVNVKELITNIGSGVGSGAAPAGAPAGNSTFTELIIHQIYGCHDIMVLPGSCSAVEVLSFCLRRYFSFTVFLWKDLLRYNICVTAAAAAAAPAGGDKKKEEKKKEESEPESDDDMGFGKNHILSPPI